MNEELLNDPKGGTSNCCGAGTNGDSMICEACGEHCEEEKENWEDSIDEMVRDFTSVIPRAKSEVRERITNLLSNQKKEILEEVLVELTPLGVIKG